MTSLLVDAGPGTGKTTTLVALTRLISLDREEAYRTDIPKLIGFNPTEEQLDIFEYVLENFPQTKHICMLAYNTTIKDELKSRVPSSIDVRTIHSLGKGLLFKRFGKQHLEKSKWIKLIEDLEDSPWLQIKQEKRAAWKYAQSVISMLKENLLNPTDENIEWITHTYSFDTDISLEDGVTQLIHDLYERSCRIDRYIDFQDMIWGPIYHNAVKDHQFDVGFIDESHDLSVAKLELISQVCKHAIYVGDPNQSIYAFAGADAEAYTKIGRNADQILPLKVSFRCPTKIVELANTIQPNGSPLLPAPGASAGSINKAEYDSLPDLCRLASHKCMILSRTTAPLISACLILTRNNIRAYVMGQDIAKKLANIIEDFDCFETDALLHKVDAWQQRIFEMEEDKPYPNVQKMLRVTDEADCIRSLAEGLDRTADIFPRLKKVFPKGKETNSVRLCTMHKAKGLESPKVLILNEVPTPHPLATTPLQIKQENNLLFVAVTRTKADLYKIGKRSMDYLMEQQDAYITDY